MMLTEEEAREKWCVPCNGCNLCCHGDVIMLLPDEGDDVSSYDHEIRELPGIGSGPVLRKKATGECVYLSDGKCSIWERAPAICRVFDCRRWYLSKTRAERKRLVAIGIADKAIFDAGRERVHTLPEHDGEARSRRGRAAVLLAAPVTPTSGPS